MLITLLTDFGTADYFVGAMKGAIFSINENARVADITHEIAPQNITAASFTLAACYKDFPRKTIFVAIVDPGVGSHRKAILVETADYYFVAPDNGLLSFIFNDEKRSTVYELTNEKFFAAEVSRTFHGRDVFAPVAAHLSNGVEPHEFGAPVEDYVRLPNSAPRKISGGETQGEVLHADRFGNLITNFRRNDLPEKFALEIAGREITKFNEFFAEAEQSELFVIAGSAGFLEIAAFQDSAKEILNVAAGEKIRLKIKENSSPKTPR